jgi:hypothetical protein
MNKSRTASGRIPQKRGDTLVKTIEKKYNVDLGYRSDAKLSTVLKSAGSPSLSKLIQMIDATKKA